MICGIKGYPYWNTELETIVVEWLKELADAANFGNSWSSMYEFHYEKPVVLGNKAVNLRFECGPAMYNDFYSGNTYRGYFNTSVENSIRLDYSGKSQCIDCDFTVDDNLSTTAMECDRCNNLVECEKCGCQYQISDMICIDGVFYCQDCTSFLTYCDHCDELFDYDRNGYIDFHIGIREENLLYSINPCFLCESCGNSMIKPGANLYYEQVWFYELKDLSEKGLSYFFGTTSIEDAKKIMRESGYPMLKDYGYPLTF